MSAAAWWPRLRSRRAARQAEELRRQVEGWFAAAVVPWPGWSGADDVNAVWAPVVSDVELAALWQAWPRPGGAFVRVSRLRSEVVFGPLRVHVTARVPRRDCAAAWARAVLVERVDRAPLAAGALLFGGVPGDPITLTAVGEVLAVLVDDVLAGVMPDRQWLEVHEVGWVWGLLEVRESGVLVETARALCGPDGGGRVVALPAGPVVPGTVLGHG